jgi:hypothetical protein
MNENNFITLIKVGLAKDNEEDELGFPAAWPMVNLNTVDFTPEVSAALMMSIFECIINTISESDQINFEKESIKIFNRLIKKRENHMEKINLTEDND